MKDSSYPIRKALTTIITALGYQVFDRVPELTASPYCWIYNQSYYQDGTQEDFGQIASVSIDVVAMYDKDFGGAKTTDDMSGAIIHALCNFAPLPITIIGFETLAITLEGTNNLFETTATHAIYTTTIRLKFKLFET